MNLLPNKKLNQEALAVFYYVVVCVYSWSMVIFFWDFPAFLLRFSVSETIGFLSYQLAYALAESVIVTVSVLALIFIIPIKRLRSKISAVGGLFVLSFAVSSIIFKELVPIIVWIHSFSISVSISTGIAFALWLFTLLGLPTLSVISTKNTKVTAVISNFSENLSVLAFLYVALSVVSIFIVIYRNFL